MTNNLLPIDQMVPGANLNAYVRAVGSIPVLSAERERELAEDLYYNENLEAARELVMSHLRFVVHIARSYSGYGLNQGDLIQEQMLSELINEGEIHRLMKKNLVIYKQRRDCLCLLLTQHFSEIAQWETPSGGLAIWLEFQSKISLVKLAKEAEKNDLFLPKTILYQDKNTCAIRFGFGHLNLQELENVIIKLKAAYTKVLIKFIEK